MADGETLVQFGKNLVRIRKELGWSQEALGISSGIGRSYMSGIELGKRNIGLLNIVKLADTMGIKPSMLMDF